MEKTDILARVYSKQLNNQTATAVTDEIYNWINQNNQQHKHTPFREYMQMDEYEFAAYAQGADFETLAQWRYHGWPTKCLETGKPINHENYGWMVKVIDGKTGLVTLLSTRQTEKSLS